MFLGRKATSVGAVFAAAVAMIFAAVAPAHAAPSIDTSGLDISAVSGATLTNDNGVYDNGDATGNALYVNVSNVTVSQFKLTNVSLVVNYGSGDTTYNFDDMTVGPDDSGTASIYFEGNPDVTDLNNATSIKVKGTAQLPSSFATSLSSLLQTKGLTLVDSNVYYTGSETRMYAAIQNAGAGKLFSVANVKFDGIASTGANTVWALPSKQTSYVSLGSITQDVSWGRADKALTVDLTALTPSKVTKKSLKVAAGLKLSTPSALDFNFGPADSDAAWANKTLPCLTVQNTTSKQVTIKATLNWVVDGKKDKGTGYSVTSLASKSSTCISGVVEDSPTIAGDIRSGHKVTVDGSFTLVAASKFVGSGLTLPTGFSISNSNFVYDSKTKKTTIVLFVASPADFVDDLKGVNIKVNGKLLATSNLVAGPPQFGGGEDTTVYRVFELGTLKGDLRYGAKVKLGGTFTTSAPIQVDSSALPNTGEGQSYCYTYYNQNWDYSVAKNETTVTLQCVNQNAYPVTFDLSGIIGTFTPLDGRPVSGVNVATPVTIQPNAFKLVGSVKFAGDVRTGGGNMVLEGTWTSTK